VDDSVAWIVAGAPRLLRRARGYAPLPVLLKEDAPTILATGAHLKNTVALSVGRRVFISQHIGDLETPEALTAFERVIADFLRLYEAEPVAIAHDLHPDYLSTKWAMSAAGHGLKAGDGKRATYSRKPETIGVQHHHAHLAACLAENQVAGPALGVTWDGAGLGTDGTVWGGEFLLGDAAGYRRVAHLRPFRLPGGDAAVHEPRRAALALLWELYGEAALAMTGLAPVAAFSPAERGVLGRMLDRGVNAPVTTSAGRLFDGIAALAGLQQRVAFEAQAAMALEFAADGGEQGAYPLDLVEGSDYVLDWRPLVEDVLADVRRGVPAAIISARYHNGLVDAIVRVSRAVGQPRVALTGGCFQNRLLTERTVERLARAGFEVLLHRLAPPNDGGISLGQVAVAAALLGRQQKTV
jgi:hydrogenase maturation protein HypF